jgi:DNA-binding response OmpR family regulator
LEGRVLIIEDNIRNRNLLRRRFVKDGLEVGEATTGAEGITEAIRLIPPVIVLSTSLPDMPGIEVAARLRTINRVKHVWLMMIADKDNRRERLTGLDTGANDFITSPIDADLVALRVRNALQRQNLENHTDPVTSMPAGRGVQAALRQLVRDREGEWALMRFSVQHLDQLRKATSRQVSNDVLRGTARILAEALNNAGAEDDFLGYGGRDDFIVITHQDRVQNLKAVIANDFNAILSEYYTAGDYEKGSITYQDQEYPLASMRIQSVTPQDGPFYDIRSLTEALASR